MVFNELVLQVAPRLTVIVSQSSSRDSRTVDQEETLVAQLMMTAGLDATLIGPIESIRLDSTDYLCLSGFNHNFGFVSWLDEPVVVEHWKRLGLPGTVARLGGLNGNSNGAMPKPRIYFFQIDARDGGAGILSQLQQLQQERAVQTVGIAVGSIAAKSSTDTPPKRVQANPPQSPHLPDNISTSPVPHSQKASAATSNNEDSADEDSQWEQLDQLVDDLDAFDF